MLNQFSYYPIIIRDYYKINLILNDLIIGEYNLKSYL